MSHNKDSSYGSLYVTVTRESANNYRSFLHREKRNRILSRQKEAFTEEADPVKDHPHLDNKIGFS